MWRKTCSISMTRLTWTGPRSDPGVGDDGAENNHLSHGTCWVLKKSESCFLASVRHLLFS